MGIQPLQMKTTLNVGVSSVSARTITTCKGADNSYLFRVWADKDAPVSPVPSRERMSCGAKVTREDTTKKLVRTIRTHLHMVSKDRFCCQALIPVLKLKTNKTFFKCWFWSVGEEGEILQLNRFGMLCRFLWRQYFILVSLYYAKHVCNLQTDRFLSGRQTTYHLVV